jgi:hypothetical protein
MKKNLALLLLFAAVCTAQESVDHKNELAFGLGGIPALSQSDSPSLGAGSGIAYEVNYGRRLLKGHLVALFGEINFVASPSRDVSGAVGTATHDFASLYVTPGIRVKFRPSSRISPYAADMPTTNRALGRSMASLTRRRGNLLAAFSILARASTFGCGDSYHSAAKLVTSIPVPGITTLLRSRVGSTTS